MALIRMRSVDAVHGMPMILMLKGDEPQLMQNMREVVARRIHGLPFQTMTSITSSSNCPASQTEAPGNTGIPMGRALAGCLVVDRKNCGQTT